MSNSYFNFTTGRMVAGENALAEDVNAAFDGVAAGLDLLPTPDQIKFLAGAHETTTGSSGNFVLAVTADAYFDGMAVSFKANHSNSGACTLNVGSLGAKQLVDGNGSELAVGDIVANSIYAARYNSTSDKFHLVGLSSGNAADAAVIAANITDIGTLADNIDELLTVDDNATAAAGSATDASGYADDALTQAGLASDYADAAAASAANLPNATTAGADKILTTNATGDGWEYPAITAAGKALLDDASAAAQRATLGIGASTGKNLLINGGFDVWQRGTSFNVGNAYKYTADRWYAYCPRMGEGTRFERGSFAIGQIDVPFNPSYYMRCTMDVSLATAAGTLQYKIPNVAFLSGREVTLSFYAKADAAKYIAVNAIQYFGSGGSSDAKAYDYAEKATLTTSWARKSFTFMMPSVSGKTIGTGDTYTAIYIFMSYDGSPVSGYPSGSEMVAQEGVFDFANVQLEFGDTATDFEYRHPAEELALCQRYYETGVLRGPFSQYDPDYAVGPYCPFLVQKRVAPTVTLGVLSTQGHDGTPGALYSANASPRFLNPVYNWTGGTVGRSFFGQLTWIADAEL